MNMMLITLSSFLAVIVISAHIRGDRRNPVPRWLKAVPNRLSLRSVHITRIISSHLRFDWLG